MSKPVKKKKAWFWSTKRMLQFDKSDTTHTEFCEKSEWPFERKNKLQVSNRWQGFRQFTTNNNWCVLLDQCVKTCLCELEKTFINFQIFVQGPFESLYLVQNIVQVPLQSLHPAAGTGCLAAPCDEVWAPSSRPSKENVKLYSFSSVVVSRLLCATQEKEYIFVNSSWNSVAFN